MSLVDFSIDLHCHPTYKPLGKSYNNFPGVQSADNTNESSLWFYDPPTLFDKLLNFIGGLTKFSQTNFTASAYGNVWVITASLGSIEKWFFNNRLGTGIISDVLGDFASQVSIPRINAIQNMHDYFKDLLEEFAYLKEVNEKKMRIDGQWFMYRIVNSFAELQQVIDTNTITIGTAGANSNSNSPIILAIVPTIEGMHVLNCGLEKPCNPDEVKANALAIKNFPNKPWFVTFTHHFYNELCGHSLSLQGFVAQKCDQSFGIDTGFTDLGKEVLDILLDNTNGKRILIDIKHLSPLGRREYFAIRKAKYPDVPIIISHGVCNGLPNENSTVSTYPALGDTFHNNTIVDGKIFNCEINFYDEEILEMVNSHGIIGLQLDEHRIANEETIKNTKHSLFRNKIMHYRSELLWRQVQYIAELLDDNNLPAWDNMAIGSDYDGIVDPLNSFWTTEQYPDLKSYLERHAFNYTQHGFGSIKNDFNKIDASTIVQNIFQTNAWAFYKKWF